MLRILIGSMFLLSQAPVAHADTPWVPAYAADAEVEGLPVVAKVEERFVSPLVPQAGVQSLTAVVQKELRLQLIVSEKPFVAMSFPMEARFLVDNAGLTHQIFASVPRAPGELRFVLIPDANGSLHVTYAREGAAPGGAFDLSPLPHVL